MPCELGRKAESELCRGGMERAAKRRLRSEGTGRLAILRSCQPSSSVAENLSSLKPVLAFKSPITMTSPTALNLAMYRLKVLKWASASRLPSS